jgi:membrane-associated phospholipid phosphatase
MQKLMLSALLACAAAAAPAAAQDRSVGEDMKNVLRDARFIVGAPTHATSDDLVTAGALAAVAGSLLFVDEPIQRWLQTDPFVARAIRPFDEDGPVAIMGRTWFFLLPMSAALYTAGHAFDSDNLRDAGLGCMTSNLTTTLPRTLTALLIGRQRPLVNRGAFEFELLAFGPWEQRSFPGGHASNIMSCASFFNHRFDMGIAGPAIWVLAGGVGTARILDDAHWTSDTFVGMAYGYSVGRNIALRSSERRDAREAAERTLPGLTLRFRIAF